MKVSKHVGDLLQKFEQKLIGDGLTPENAHKSARTMSVGDLEQVQKDLVRHPNIIVINKKTGRTTKIPQSKFNNNFKTQDFLKHLCSDNDALYHYLTKYAHQGGFLHLSELLTTYYFGPFFRFDIENKVATFTIEKDGSLSFEEKFDIKKVKTPETEYESNSPDPIATFTLKSHLSLNDNRITHTCSPLQIKIKDKVASKFIEHPKSNFSKFIGWVSDSVAWLFSKSYREQELKRQAVVAPRKL